MNSCLIRDVNGSSCSNVRSIFLCMVDRSESPKLLSLHKKYVKGLIKSSQLRPYKFMVFQSLSSFIYLSSYMG